MKKETPKLEITAQTTPPGRVPATPPGRVPATPPGRVPATPPGRVLATQRLPNGLQVAYQSRVELEHFYQDIFEKEIYASHGLQLFDGACVFDVGANIGLFTLFVQTRWPASRVFSFEPAPPLFEILSANAARYAPRSELFNCGVSAVSGTADFIFYPKSSGMSSFHADKGEEREVLEAVLRNEAREGVAAAQGLLRHVDDYLEDRLESVPFTCPLVTLSEIIEEHRIETIDLIKIDVQKSELAVLEGLRDGDWPRVAQIVIEVHDHEGRVETIRHLLAARGFEIQVVQDEHYEGSEMYNLYAVKPDQLRKSGQQRRPVGGIPVVQKSKVADRAARQKNAWNQPRGGGRPLGRRKR